MNIPEVRAPEECAVRKKDVECVIGVKKEEDTTTEIKFTLDVGLYESLDPDGKIIMDENVEQARPGGDCGLGILRESLFWCFVRKKPSLPPGESGEWGTRGRACVCVVS